MLYRYSGLTISGKHKRGFVEASNKTEALKLIKTNEDVKIITNISRQSESPIFRKPMEVFQKQVEEVTNKIEENKKDAKIKKIAKLKAKKERLLTKQDSNIRKSIKGLDLSFMKVGLPNNKRKKKIELDDEIYDEIFKVIKAHTEKDSEIDELQDEIEIIKKQSSEKPKLKQESLNRDRDKDSKEKKIDFSIFEQKELTPEVKKNMKLKVKPKEILLFTKRLQIMLSSGMTLMKSLKILSENKNKTMSYIVNNVLDSIQKGNPLSESLAKFPNQFDYTYISLISIGESSGSLDKVLSDIIESLEKKSKINKKLGTATLYPKMIGGVLILIMLLGSLFFIPAFRKMFADQGYALPGLTSAVFLIADYLPFIIIGGIVLSIGLKFLKANNRMVARVYQKYMDKLLLKIPVVKNVLITSYMYNFSFTVALMLKNGIRLNDALLLSEKTIKNVYIKTEINDMVALMVQGMSFSEAMSKQKFFDDILVNIVLTGEESGQLNFSLSQIAKYYNDELNKAIDNISELVQPVSIMLVGLIVVPVVVAVYLPILEVSSGALLDL